MPLSRPSIPGFGMCQSNHDLKIRDRLPPPLFLPSCYTSTLRTLRGPIGMARQLVKDSGMGTRFLPNLLATHVPVVEMHPGNRLTPFYREWIESPGSPGPRVTLVHTS